MLTGRTRVRIDWRGRVILQVEVSYPVPHFPYAPPRYGESDRRPRRSMWRDARQSDLTTLAPPFVAAPCAPA